MAKAMPTKRALSLLGTQATRHFKNAAARRKGSGEFVFTDALQLAAAVEQGLVDAKYTKIVPTKVCTHVDVPRPGAKVNRLPEPIYLGCSTLKPWTFDMKAFATRMFFASIANPKGFRTASGTSPKRKHPHVGRGRPDETLLEMASIVAGMSKPEPWVRTKRGQAKAAATAKMKEAIALERLNGIPWKHLSAYARRRLLWGKADNAAIAA